MARLEPGSSLPVRGARRTRGMRVSTQLAEINVVPLVDVMLVLLVIFMVAAPMMQQGFGIQLPQAKNTSAIEATPVTISVPLDFPRNHRVYINDELIPVQVLQERITQALGGHLDRNVIVQGDGGVTLQDLFSVMDILKAAGVEKVGLPTQPPVARRPK